MTNILGPVACISCHREVFWDRIGDQLRLMEQMAYGPRAHTCRRKPVRSTEKCGAPMPIAQDVCARSKGHRDGHRSRYDLDNQARKGRMEWAA